MNLAFPTVSTVKPFCNKRITLTHTANNQIQAKQTKISILAYLQDYWYLKICNITQNNGNS